MADTKISALTQVAPSLDDFVPFVDMADTTTKKATFTQIKTTILPTDNTRWGILDYNDLLTATTPISIPWTSTFTALTNDWAGAFTNKTYAPVGVTDIWSTSNNRFEWTQLKKWDSVYIRLDIEVTVSSVNTEIQCDIFLAEWGSSYNLPLINTTNFKNTWTYRLVQLGYVYFWDDNTKNNTAKFKIKADKACTVKVNGWACDVQVRG